MRRGVILIITMVLALPLYSQNIRQIRSDTSVIYAEGTGNSPEESESVATEELLLKLSRTSIIEGTPERVLKIWKTYSSEVRALGSVIFEGQIAARYIKWNLIEKVFDSRKKTVSDLLNGAGEAISSGRPALARTYLNWVDVYLQTLPQSDAERARFNKLSMEAGEGDCTSVNMKHIVRETAEIRRILGLRQEKKSETAIVKEEQRPIVKSEEVLKLERPKISLESVHSPVGLALFKNSPGIVQTQKLSPTVQEPVFDYSATGIPGKFSAYIRTVPVNPFALGVMAVYRFGGVGVYASFIKSLTSVSSGYDCKSDGTTSYGFFWASGKEKKTALSVSAGAVVPISGPFEVYFGGGYGTSSVYWEDTSASWAKVTDKSFKGVFCEAGIIVNVGRFSISGGLGTTVFKSVVPIAAIGICF